MKLLEGKAVVITGSGRGIGAACARGAASQGAALVINDVDPALAEATAEEIRASGGKAVACVADIADWTEAERPIRACVEAFGRIDGLVNNAGLAHVTRLADFEPRQARALIEVNVLGSLHCAAHAVKPMLAQGSGSIINVTSGAHMGLPGLGTYAASKGAVTSMVYCWALELAGTGVRINALSPVAAGTGMSADDPDGQKPEANAAIVEFLLSDRAAGVNGQIVRIDRREIHLYAHPALLLPPAINESWTGETVAEAFAIDFKDRLVPCGVMGIEGQAVRLDGLGTAKARTGS
jgi:NAD(P)-dependent dehydrogenase (short-subunit alcohol dehydrogenase family)